jgi:hypothetical protein
MRVSDDRGDFTRNDLDFRYFEVSGLTLSGPAHAFVLECRVGLNWYFTSTPTSIYDNTPTMHGLIDAHVRFVSDRSCASTESLSTRLSRVQDAAEI